MAELLSNVSESAGVVYKTVTSDGTKGYALVETDVHAEDPWTDVEVEGTLYTRVHCPCSGVHDPDTHISKILEVTLKADPVLRMKFYRHIENGDYTSLKIGSVNDPRLQFASYLEKDRHKRAVYSRGTGYHDYQAVYAFDYLEDLDEIDLSYLFQHIGSQELYGLYEEAYPNRFIVPLTFIDSVRDGGWHAYDDYSTKDGFWEFDFDSYSDCKNPFGDDPEKWRDNVMEYVRGVLKTVSDYYNNNTFFVTLCDEEDVDVSEIEKAVKYASKHKYLSVDIYEAYRDLICDASCDAFAGSLYGCEDIREFLKSYDTVSVEEIG